MKFVRLALLIALPFTLTACGDSTPSDAPAVTAQVVDDLGPQTPNMKAARKHAKGFDTGNLTSARQVYVFFDPQGAESAALWQEAKLIAKETRLTWVPVALTPTSLAPAAALLAYPNPAQVMAEQAALSQDGSAHPHLTEIVMHNTSLLERFGVTSVPFVLGRNLQTGEPVAYSGNLAAATLADKLGWLVPEEPKSAGR